MKTITPSQIADYVGCSKRQIQRLASSKWGIPGVLGTGPRRRFHLTPELRRWMDRKKKDRIPTNNQPGTRTRKSYERSPRGEVTRGAPVPSGGKRSGERDERSYPAMHAFIEWAVAGFVEQNKPLSDYAGDDYDMVGLPAKGTAEHRLLSEGATLLRQFAAIAERLQNRGKLDVITSKTGRVFPAVHEWMEKASKRLGAGLRNCT
ncbi:MAG TPA: helix-turn-helix domain-containing protein [Verrucomicrobiales bacterium]|nr:helix-turn-helix domain-containing protein [Verrucomicrobiales bacterium]